MRPFEYSVVSVESREGGGEEVWQEGGGAEVWEDGGTTTILELPVRNSTLSLISEIHFIFFLNPKYFSESIIFFRILKYFFFF